MGYEFIVAIVAIVMVTGLLKSWIKVKHETNRNGVNLEDELGKLGVASQLAKVDELEKRVRVLEKLATDKKRNLADEIDDL